MENRKERHRGAFSLPGSVQNFPQYPDDGFVSDSDSPELIRPVRKGRPKAGSESPSDGQSRFENSRPHFLHIKIPKPQIDPAVRNAEKYAAPPAHAWLPPSPPIAETRLASPALSIASRESRTSKTSTVSTGTMGSIGSILANVTPVAAPSRSASNAAQAKEISDFLVKMIGRRSPTANQKETILLKLAGLPEGQKTLIAANFNQATKKELVACLQSKLSGHDKITALAYWRNKKSRMEAADMLYLHTNGNGADNPAIFRLLEATTARQIDKINAQMTAIYGVTLEKRIQQKMWRADKDRALFLLKCPRNDNGKISKATLKAEEFHRIRGYITKHRDKTFHTLEQMSSADIQECAQVYQSCYKKDLVKELKKEIQSPTDSKLWQLRLDSALVGIKGNNDAKCQYAARTFKLIFSRTFKHNDTALHLLTKLIDNDGGPTGSAVANQYRSLYGRDFLKDVKSRLPHHTANLASLICAGKGLHDPEVAALRVGHICHGRYISLEQTDRDELQNALDFEGSTASKQECQVQIQQTLEHYAKLYGKAGQTTLLERDLTKALGGKFKKGFKTIQHAELTLLMKDV